jgi:hypothetical protein
VNKIAHFLKRYGQYLLTINARRGDSGAFCFSLMLLLTILASIKFPVVTMQDPSGYFVWFIIYPVGWLLVIRDHYIFFAKKRGAAASDE